MNEQAHKRATISEAIYAKEIGRQMLEVLKSGGLQTIEKLAREEAVLTLERIRAVLDDPALDDPECFQKIEAIVDVLSDAGVSTARHDW